MERILAGAEDAVKDAADDGLKNMPGGIGIRGEGAVIDGDLPIITIEAEVTGELRFLLDEGGGGFD